jgi:hypothetical protein
MSDDSMLLEEILKNATTRTYAEYVSSDFGVEKEQIELGRALEKQVLEQFASYIANQGYVLGTVPQEKLEWAREQLFGGRVTGVDGRRDKPIDIISGVFCEIGIAAVTYQTLSKPELSCRSITSHLEESTTAKEYYENLQSDRLREGTITSAMICWELEACLNSKTEWVFKDGPILHPDLIWRGYPFLIDLLKKVVNHKKIMGVVKDLRGEGSIPLRRLGKLLKPNQFLVIYKGVSGDWIRAIRLSEIAKRFLAEEGSKVWRGVFKAHVKSYGFEIHEEHFNDGIALLMADAMNNKRGVPNLVDQADAIAGNAFPSGLFGEKMRREFLLAGMGEYWELIDEHMLRG